jgi:uncharacterized protein (DUF488 family)
MFKRHKILLGLLEQFDGELSRTSLQKLLFLYCERSAEPVYEFVPYKYGCFSFQAAADHRKLVTKGLLADSDKWRLKSDTGILAQLDYTDRQALWTLKKRFGTVSQRELVRHVYTSYPYYATRSDIAAEVLTPEEQEIVTSHQPQVSGPVLFSIGYEGLKLEGYLNKLIRNNIRVVCDVRKNPLSRKFGFSKTALSNALDRVGIEYRHLPTLGIVSDKRQELNTQSDYDALFDEYEKTTLKLGHETVSTVAKLLWENERIALLCFEKLPEQCHRTRVANVVLALYEKDCSVITECS